MTRPADFAARYGRWALVAGGSAGIGAAFARALAQRGLDLILVARRAQPLAELAATLPPGTRTVAADLSTLEGLAEVAEAAAGLEVGFVVANAAYSPIGDFLSLPLDRALRALDLNCRAPLWLAHHFLPPMAERGRGGFVVLSSLSGLQGAPPLTVYSATKAFDAVLAEGLWAECRGRGVDVLTTMPGAVSTPGLAGAAPKRVPGTVTPEAVVAATLRRLGHGPRTVPGALMRASSVLMSRLLPRRTAIAMISRASAGLKPERPAQ